LAELHTDALVAALVQLEAGRAEAEAAPHSTLLRDGVIQRFEYTVDLCWKLLQRYLRHIAQVPETDLRTKKDLFREAARRELIADPQTWFDYYDTRNQTSHTYDADIASDIYAHAQPLAADARRLLEVLRDAA